MQRFQKEKVRVQHPYSWVWEPFEEDPGFVLRSMFGAKSVYLNGRILLCCTAGEEPWHGVLVCTEYEHQESLRTTFPQLKPHAILGKWLYLSEGTPGFERVIAAIVRSIKQGDPRIGVVPKPKKPRVRQVGGEAGEKPGPVAKAKTGRKNGARKGSGGS